MTYIIGTNFSIVKQGIKPGITSSSSKGKILNNFLPPGNYTINYIKPTNDGVEYTFADDNLSQLIVKFKTIGEAEQYIALAKGEKLPNYTEVYKKLS